MYLYREYFKAKVYTVWVHGPLGNPKVQDLNSGCLCQAAMAPTSDWHLSSDAQSEWVGKHCALYPKGPCTYMVYTWALK